MYLILFGFHFFSLQGERATGYGVALLCTLFGNLTNVPLLKSIAPKAQ